jgi:hypothetical protein
MKNVLTTQSVSCILQKRGKMLLILLTMMSIIPARMVDAQAMPEITLAFEAAANEFTSDDSEYTASPQIKLEWPAYELTLEANWYIPYHPEVNSGELEVLEEYIIHLPVWWLDLKLANSDTWIFEESELEGTVSAGPVAYFLGTEFELMLEKQYAPESGLTLVPSLLYEFELMRGTAGIGVTHTIDIDGTFTSGDTEFPIAYDFDATDTLAVGFELLPVLTEDQEWNCSATLALEWGLN